MKKVSKVSSKINMTKIILLIITIVGFAVIIYFVVKYFKTTCPEGSHYDKSFNSCVKNCPEGQVNDIDGSCVCPDRNQQFKNGKCINVCQEPLELCGGTCQNLSNGKCMSDDTYCPDTLLCGDYCVIPGYYCSNGNINFPNDDTFILSESDKSANITVPKGNYALIFVEHSDFKSLGNELQDLLNAASPNKYFYTITVKDNKLNFVISKDKVIDTTSSTTSSTTPSTDLIQPIFNFTNTTNPDKFGFKNSTYSFINNKLESQFGIENYTLVKGNCPEEKLCGNICCDKGECVTQNGIKTCCDKDSVCGEGDNKTCCPKNADGTSNCCNGKCCNVGNGEKCVKDLSGVEKCLKKCSAPGPKGEDVYCDTLSFTPGTGENFCEIVTDPNTKSEVSYCKHKDCVFNFEQYYPANVVDGLNPANEVAVCSTPDNKFYSKYITNKSLTRELITTYAVDTSKCSPEDCVSKLIELGASEMHPEPDKGKCNTTFNCELLLNSNPDQCPFRNNTQCCTIGGTFTGQVCKEGMIAEPDPENANECLCIQGWGCSQVENGEICAIIKDGDQKPAKFYTNKESCDCKCNFGYTGEKCQNFNRDVESIKKLFSPYVQSALSYTGYDPYGTGNYLLYLIIIPSNKKSLRNVAMNSSNGWEVTQDDINYSNSSACHSYQSPQVCVKGAGNLQDLLRFVQSLGGRLFQGYNTGIGLWFSYEKTKDCTPATNPDGTPAWDINCKPCEHSDHTDCFYFSVHEDPNTIENNIGQPYQYYSYNDTGFTASPNPGVPISIDILVIG